MKRRCILSVVVLGGLLWISSCVNTPTIVGTWEVESATGAMVELNVGTVYKFDDIGNLTMSKGGFDNRATYKIAADKLTYTVGPVTVTADFEIEGDKLILEIANSDQKILLKRKP